jgi:hypothetical protein
MRFVSGRVRRASGNARLVRALNLLGRRGLSGCCGVHRQWRERLARQLFACRQSLCRPRWLAFFRRRIALVSGRRLHPALRESYTSAQRFRLLRGCSCFGIVAHRGADENYQMARSCPLSCFSSAEIILLEKSLICASVSVASLL